MARHQPKGACKRGVAVTGAECICAGLPSGKPTEFLILVDRYMRQARELQALAGPNGSIQVDCDHAGTLLQILGYRLKMGCGQKGAFLATADA